MRGIYLSNYNLAEISSGVSKKISMQLDAFIQNGIEIEAPKVFADSYFAKAYVKLPFVSSVYDLNIKKYIISQNLNEIHFVYLRHNLFTQQLYKNLKRLKLKGIKVLYEIPTYPYDRNEHKLKNTFMRSKDKYWREKCGKYIDYIIDYSGSDFIYGVKTINISNGINPDFIVPKKEFSHDLSIHMIGVALMAPVHAFDRVINSIQSYYELNPKRKIYFHIIGNGDSRPYLESLTRKLGMKEYIIFHGLKYGKELDKLYDIADIGVGVLGIHRRYANQKVSSLKTKEYAAKGIPFISAEYDDAFEKYECDFKFMIEQNDSNFSIIEMLNWYDSIISKHISKEKLAEYIRNYAYRYLTWKEQISKVLLEAKINS
ncbi:MAG: glycosyltransferase [Hungatella sp.]|nr:glycosyltransferase [Hungatella sp.]